MKNTEIPADKSNYGVFTQIYDESQKNLKAIIKEVSSTKNEPGSERQKVGDYYRSFMDTVTIEKLGYQPLKPFFERINAVKSKEDLVDLMAWFSKIGVRAPIGIGIGQDAREATKYAVYTGQSGLGLPDRDYYLKDNAKFKDIRQKYSHYIQKLFELTEIENGRDKADRILDIETSLAKNQWSRVENRDPIKRYNKYEIAKLNELTPDFNWTRYLDGNDIKNIDYIINFN